MSVYHSSFNYLGINSRLKNLIVAHFDADSGEVETNLNLEPVYTDSSMNMRRYDYGAKWSSVATFRITTIKPDGSDFSVAEVRGYLKWLTGTYTNTTLDLLVGDQIKCTFIGRFTNVWQQKEGARTVGLIMEFTSNSPFAYSPKQVLSYSVTGTHTFKISNPSDDLFSDVFLKTTYTNKSGNTLSIENTTTDNVTEVSALASNETIIIDGPMAISSDKPAKSFGNSFNFIFPKIIPGINEIVIKGTGTITFEYSYPIKIGNVAVDIEELNGAIDCDSNPNPGVVFLEHPMWENILNKPTTLAGYGITDAYTKTQVDEKIQDLDDKIETTEEKLNNKIDDTKAELDNKIDTTKTELVNQINTVNTTLNNKIDSTKSDLEQQINNAKKELNQSITDTKNELSEDIDATNERIDELQDSTYTKDEVDSKISSVYKYMGSVVDKSKLPTTNLVVGHVYNLEDTGMNIAWNGTEWDNLGPTIDLTPYLTKSSAAATYATKSEVQNQITNLQIDENELNTMLTEVLV